MSEIIKNDVSEIRTMTQEIYDGTLDDRMHEVFAFAGSTKRLAIMLGISFQNATIWERVGRISKPGAILIERHVVLGEKFKAVYLRPDLYLLSYYEAKQPNAEENIRNKVNASADKLQKSLPQ